MPAKLPYHKWFWADWFRDTRCLSALSRGVWIDVIGYLRESTPNGTATWDEESWCRLLTITPTDLKSALSEFKKYEICTVEAKSNGLITLLSRRIKREKRHIRNNKLRQRRFKDNGPVTPESHAGTRLNHSQSQKQSQRSESEAEKEKILGGVNAGDDREEIPPCPPKTDPIARGQWKKIYGGLGK